MRDMARLPYLDRDHLSKTRRGIQENGSCKGSVALDPTDASPG